ncbi:MAG: hypothetical protein ACE5NG_03960 [bacterium]
MAGVLITNRLANMRRLDVWKRDFADWVISGKHWEIMYFGMTSGLIGIQ